MYTQRVIDNRPHVSEFCSHALGSRVKLKILECVTVKTTEILKSSMHRRVLMSCYLALLSSTAIFACSGEKNGKGDGDGDDASDTDISLSGNGDGDGGSIIGRNYDSSDGGTADLTDKQVKNLLSAECVGAEAEGERVPATLELVIDVSGSMNKTVAGNTPRQGEASKWDTTKAALMTAVEALPSSVSFGAVYYPNKNATVHSPNSPGPANSCINVEASLPLASLGQPGSAQRDAFQKNIDSVYVENYTPTHDAYTYALNEQLAPFPGLNKFILLITDGAPTIDGGCRWPRDDGKAFPLEVGTGDGSFDAVTAPIVADIQAARDEQGVRTFVIGAPGSELSVESSTDMRPWLSAAAQAGGTEVPGCSHNGPNYCHFDMSGSGSDFSSDLTFALASIAGQVSNICTFKIPDPPNGEALDENKTQVIVEWGDDTNQLIYPDSIGECQGEGWRYNEEDQTVETCGATCDRIKLDFKAVVHVSFGCASTDIIVR